MLSFPLRDWSQCRTIAAAYSRGRTLLPIGGSGAIQVRFDTRLNTEMSWVVFVEKRFHTSPYCRQGFVIFINCASHVIPLLTCVYISRLLKEKKAKLLIFVLRNFGISIQTDPQIKSVVPLPKLCVPAKFHKNLPTSFWVILLTGRQKNHRWWPHDFLGRCKNVGCWI